MEIEKLEEYVRQLAEDRGMTKEGKCILCGSEVSFTIEGDRVCLYCTRNKHYLVTDLIKFLERRMTDNDFNYRLIKRMKETHTEQQPIEITPEKEEAITECLEKGYTILQTYHVCKNIKKIEVTLDEIKNVKKELEARNE